MSSNDNFDQIKKDWEKFSALCGKIEREGIQDILDTLGERICLCPYATHDDQIGSYPGGLVRTAISIAGTMKKVSSAYGVKLSSESLLLVGLLHDLGKIGSLEQDLFLEQDSDWHREKLGQLYKYNEDLSKMSVSHRTLFLLQHFGVKVSNDEWLAIQLAQGSHFEENRFYVGAEPDLALILQQAKRFVTRKQ